MADENFEISYTSKDYQSIKDDLINIIPSLTDDWTDFRESDTGIVVLKLMAVLGDMMFYDLDRKALENYLDAVQEKSNARGILQNIGYKMKNYISSITEVDFSTTHSKDISIPRYTQLSTSSEDGENIKFVTNNIETEVLQSELELTNIPVIQGVTDGDEYSYSDIDDYNRITLPDNNIAEGTVKLEINSQKWDEVDDVLILTDSGYYFHVGFNDDDSIFIELYPGWENLIRYPEDMEIDVSYILSDGEDGEVGRHKIINVDSKLYDVDGEEVTDTVSVVNEEGSTGGEDPQSIDNVRGVAPQVVQTMFTAVTTEDYEILTEEYPGIVKCFTIDWDINDGVEETKATASIGSGDNGTVNITYDIEGEDGNDYSVEVVDNSGTSDVDLSVSLEDKILTIDLGTGSGGSLDPSKNTATLIADEINNIIELDMTAEASGDGSSAISSAESVSFTGGIGPSGPYEVHLYVVPNDGGNATSNLKDELLDYFEGRKVATTKVLIRDTTYYPIDITVDVTKSDSVSETTIRNSINNALDNFFSPDNREHNEIINYTEILRTIESADSNIYRASMITPASNIEVPYSQFPVLGDTTINFT